VRHSAVGWVDARLYALKPIGNAGFATLYEEAKQAKRGIEKEERP